MLKCLQREFARPAARAAWIGPRAPPWAPCVITVVKIFVLVFIIEVVVFVVFVFVVIVFIFLGLERGHEVGHFDAVRAQSRPFSAARYLRLLRRFRW